jgi:antitoxin (DNA-binding transcriptional repressor) of toxin-antitoxin stability system
MARRVHSVTVHQAKTHLSRLLRSVEAGDEVVILRGRIPIARLVLPEGRVAERRLGGAKGLVRMAPDFDAPLDDFADYR